MNLWRKFVSWVADNPYVALIIVGFLALWVYYDTMAIKAVRQQRVRQREFDAIFPEAPPLP